jgi:hypothetical protein
MPVRHGNMKMFISNGHPTLTQQKIFNSINVAQKSAPTPSALNAPIISRIHNVKPGCNSCGR